jgi:hypothetical protein
VEIYREQGGKYNGKIVWEQEPRTKDGRNKIGMFLQRNFDLQKDQLVNGKVIDPDSGKEYDCRLLAEDDGTLTMKVKYGLLSFNDRPTRVKQWLACCSASAAGTTAAPAPAWQSGTVPGDGPGGNYGPVRPATREEDRAGKYAHGPEKRDCL